MSTNWCASSNLRIAFVQYVAQSTSSRKSHPLLLPGDTAAAAAAAERKRWHNVILIISLRIFIVAQSHAFYFFASHQRTKKKKKDFQTSPSSTRTLSLRCLFHCSREREKEDSSLSPLNTAAMRRLHEHLHSALALR